MYTLQITRLDISQIPEILLPLTDGEDTFFQESYEVPVHVGGEELTLVFDVDYSETVERGGGLKAEPWTRLLYTSITVDNLRLEDEGCNVIPVDNLSEIEKELTNHKIHRGK